MSHQDSTPLLRIYTALDATDLQAGLQLGARASTNGTSFAVHARAERVSVHTVDPMTRRHIQNPMNTSEAEPTIWRWEARENLSGWRYWFEVQRDGKTFSQVVDPYATMVRGDIGYIEQQAWDEVQVDARPSRPKLDPADAVIYELHIRDFSRDPLCGVSAGTHGRFLGLTEHGTVLEGGTVSTCLDHILELGVNVVQLMPVQSFATPHRRWHEWGYMPTDWFSPHQAYASGVDVEAAGQEFTTLVDTLHGAGLRVTIDVVFNHNAETDTLGVRSLGVLDPEGYFRRWDDGSLANGAGCGNEFATESRFGRQLIRDACTYWATRYSIDGFRFDLMGLIDQDTLKLVRQDLDEIDPTLLMYGEAWSAGPSPRPIIQRGFQRGSRIGVFNDQFRDRLRGDLFDETASGLLVHADAGDATRVLRGWIGDHEDDFADTPAETIQYTECHDDLTLADKLLASDPESGLAAAFDRSAIAALYLAFARGIPFLHSGQEFGRTKAGVANTYNMGDQLNNIRWALKKENHKLFRHYRRAIALRLEHPMFTTFPPDGSGIDPLSAALTSGPPAGVTGAVFHDQSNKDTWESCLLAINTSNEERSIVLASSWRAASHQSVLLSDDAPLYGTHVDGSLELKQRGFAVLYLPRDSANATAAS